jgi:hypothetical protein
MFRIKNKATDNSEGFLTSLFTLGHTLLDNTVVKLRVEELRPWYDYEKKNGSDYVKVSD